LTWFDAGAPHVWLPYTQMRTAPPPLPVVRTYGSRLVLADGRELIDGIASWWTAVHGYNHPAIAAALRAQIDVMPHVMFGGLAHEPAYRLCARLAALLPGDLDCVFLSESGSVSVEIALKMALQYHRNRGDEGRGRVLAFEDAYHGDTFGTMALCDPTSGMHAIFAGALAEHDFLPLPRDGETTAALAAYAERYGERLAAIVVEPLVQGAGGMRFHDAAVLERLRALANRAGALLIFDEIFTGFGRTGATFACEAAGVVPDIVTLSKALSGGTLPLAATIARRSVFEGFLAEDPSHALMHGPTYMANPLACAAALASLDLFATEPRLAQAAAIGVALEAGLAPLRDVPGVLDVRVRGAIGVVQLRPGVGLVPLRAAFAERGCFVRPLRDVVYLTPALTIGAEDLASLTTAVTDVVRAHVLEPFT